MAVGAQSEEKRARALFPMLAAGERSERLRFRDRVKVEQLDVALRLAPFTIVVSLSVVQVILILFWPSANRVYLGLLEAGILSLAALSLLRCRQWLVRPKPATVSDRYVIQVQATACAYGCLLGSIPIMLFVGADPELRLLVASSCAGLIATGLSAAVMPRAAISFSGPIIAGSFAGLAMTGEAFFINVAILLAFYTAFVWFTILHLSRLLTMRVMAQADLERQQEFTNLLLDDFEENASDWLWETDRDLRLQHVSARLVQVSGAPEATLQGLPLEHLFPPPRLPSPGSSGGFHERLRAPIGARLPFREVLIAVEICGERRWWSVSGKPIRDDVGGFAGYRGVGADVTEKKRSEDRLSHLAMHDSLTELPNRLSFQNALDAARNALKDGESLAVLCLDLDRFKSVNDTFGHAAGDALLQAVTRRLRAMLDPECVLARLAGDEFAILCPPSSLAGPRPLRELAAEIVERLAAPVHLDGIQVSVGVSIGIAFVPQDGREEIMLRADLALYRMKNEGRNGYRFYEAEMDERIEERRALSADLRGALERGEFLLHYQPLVSTAHGRTEGFEALLRWKHPSRGFVSPGAFIPLAEETGVIIPLGSWIVREACRTAASWPGPLSVAVNLSPIQFRHCDVPALVREALAETGLPAGRLELEITESVFLEATPAIHAMLETLRDMGVRLSLDDFGTGYSSLSYLRRIAFDKIKIDQSFVRDLPGAETGAGGVAIVRAIIELARSLDMTVTAEGVETEAQRACLAEQGCHQFQGYLFSRPVPAAQAALIAEEARRPRAA